MRRKQKPSNDGPSLAALQRTVQKAILNPPPRPPAFVADTRKASAAERFNVYSEAYRLRLVEALTADYPALRDRLGEEAFDALGRDYIDTYPSDRFSIRWIGRYLPRFIRETPPYDAQPAMGDLATFEWALSEAFDAPESTTIAVDDLAALQPALWGSLQLCFHASLRRVDLDYNAPHVWQAWNEKTPLPAFERLGAPQAWVVWRSDLRLFFRALAAAEAWALDAFSKGRCFADICEGLCEWMEEDSVAVRAAGFLRSWVEAGWITGIVSNPAG